MLAYVSAGSEVETRKLLQTAFKQGKKLAVPLGDLLRPVEALSELSDLDHLVEGALKGIFEPAPKHQKKIAASKIDYVLVPGVAFDRRGGRLGMGGGFYDRLLPHIPGAVFVGLTFSAQVVTGRLPSEAHDMKVHSVVTENEWIDIK